MALYAAAFEVHIIMIEPLIARTKPKFLLLICTWLLGAMASSLSGCSSVPPGHNDLLDFLADGTTKREEVRERLGSPSGEYEGSKIWAYRLSKDISGYRVLWTKTGSWGNVRYNLILRFNASDVLQEHRLVEIRRE